MTTTNTAEWAKVSDLSIPIEERTKIRDRLLADDESLQRLLKKDQEEKRTAMYHDIARRLVDKQGFLFAAREFIKEQPIYYDKNRLWWLWNKKETRWEMTDETEILNIITLSLRQYGIGDATVKYKNNMVEALRQEGRLNKPKDFPKHWIQFKDQIFDLQSKQTFPSTSEYFSVNTIPWSIGTDDDTPVMTQLFDSWVGADLTQTLFEIIAYLCYTDYPIHTVFCLNGTGRNGKSKFQGLIQNFLGIENVCSTELDALTDKSNRFSSFNLYKKLCCLMGETNFNVITSSSMLKKLTGQDMIPFEKKGADVFNDKNYAKIIISTNSLPPSADQSDGYYRRWFIIDFPNQFSEGKDILATIPEYEYRNLAKKVTILLPDLLERCGFLKQGTIDERRKRYIERSNPLLHFIEEFYLQDIESSEVYGTFYTHYAHWLKTTNRKVPSKKVFSKLLSMEGFEIKETSVRNDFGYFDKRTLIFGLKRRTKIGEFEDEGYSPSGGVGGLGGQVSVSSLRMESDTKYASNASNSSAARINPIHDLVSVEKSTLEILLNVIQSHKEVLRNELEKAFPDIDISSLLSDGTLVEIRSGILKLNK